MTPGALLELAREHLQQLRERRHARRVCTQVLRAHATVRARQPGLARPALYEAVIAARLRLGPEAARRVLRDAHASREDWDNPREPILRDVVLYMIVSEYLRKGKGRRGMILDLKRFLDAHVPPGL